MTGIKRFNWVARPSQWQFAQAWGAQRRQMAQRFLEDGAAASTAFANAQNNLSTGMATLAAQASILRAQNQLSAVRNQLVSGLSSINKSA